jgi:hypothetical protein
MLDPNETPPPQRPVEYLEEALYLAERTLREGVAADFQRIASIAEDLVAFRVGITASSPESRIAAYSDPTDRLLTSVEAADTRERALALPHDVQQWPPWIRYAVEFILMEESVDRLKDFANRYADLRATLVDRPIPESIDDTLNELVRLYLWGFDGPAIAMACIGFERVAKQALIALGRVTEPQLRRERRSAEELRRDLANAGLLAGLSAELEDLIRQRNALLHGHNTSGPLEGISRRWVSALAHVMEALHPSWPKPTAKVTD